MLKPGTALIHVPPLSPAATHVQKLVAVALPKRSAQRSICKRAIKSLKVLLFLHLTVFSMVYAPSPAPDACSVVMPAPHAATVTVLVLHASSSAAFAVNIQNARRPVGRCVLHVLNPVGGSVNIKVHVCCPAAHLVCVCLAMSDAVRSWRVVIAVPASVEKSAPLVPSALNVDPQRKWCGMQS